MADKAATELDALLDGERAAILSGSYDVLNALLPHKEALIERIGTEGRPSQAARLARKVMRNQALLGAAIEGVRSATGQIGAIRGQHDGFQTYDQQGERQQVGGKANVIERKV